MKKSLLDYTLRIRLPIVLFVALVSFLATFFFSRAEREGVGYSPEQPIAFSHKLHAGTMHIDCQYCHSSADRSSVASIPSVSICMNCHSIARKTSPEILKLTRQYEDGAALRWKRVHRLPDYVYFNHSVHVNKGIDCSHCHGDVAGMNGAMQVSEFSMAACLNCHRNVHTFVPEVADLKPGPENCAACHR